MGQLTEIGIPPERSTIISTALASGLRGKFCDLLLANRKTTTFGKHALVYDIGDRDRTLFFLKSGFVKVGTVISDGREVIYDVRKGGDVIGELGLSEQERPDRATTLEQTEVFPVPFEELKSLLTSSNDLTAALIDVFCSALKEAYSQVTTLATDDTMKRLARVLLNLAKKTGQPTATLTEIPVYLTQQEIAQLVAARRERISTALNLLRQQGLVQYTARGRLLIDVRALRALCGG